MAWAKAGDVDLAGELACDLIGFGAHDLAGNFQMQLFLAVFLIGNRDVHMDYQLSAASRRELVIDDRSALMTDD